MKIGSLILTFSLAANAALAWLLWRDAPAVPPPPANTAAIVANTSAPSAVTAVATTTADATKTRAALREQLRAFGFTDDEIRAAVRAQIEERHLSRERELRAALGPSAPRLPGSVRGGDFNRDQNRELTELRNAERDELTGLLGSAGLAGDHDSEGYLFLLPEKAARLAAIERDYADLRRDAATLTGAEAKERTQSLTAEHDRDVAALLTPEERVELERRESTTGRSLASRLKYFDPTDAEAATLYSLQKAFDEKFPSSPAMPVDSMNARREASQKLADDVQAALGPDRFATWQLAQRSEYQALADLQRRFNIAPSAFDAIAQLPAQSSTTAQRIGGDQSLSVEQKVSALADLANQARAQIRTTLGDELGTAYINSGGIQWLSLLDRGTVYTFMPTGGLMLRSIRNSPTPQPKP